jgi:hypothetical protein
MKVIVPERYRLESDEFEEIKTSLFIDEKELYFSKLLGHEVNFEEELRNQISDIIKNGDEPFIEYIDGEFDIRVIQID